MCHLVWNNDASTTGAQLALARMRRRLQSVLKFFKYKSITRLGSVFFGGMEKARVGILADGQRKEVPHWNWHISH